MTRVAGEVRRQSAREARLRLTTYAVAAAAVLSVVPVALVAREVSEDPVFAALDDLSLPGWAAGSPVDSAHGNRWCAGECRTRERTWTSERDLPETREVFGAALGEGSWEPLVVEGCPPSVDIIGVYGCWSRDEYVLDLWVRPLPCDATDLAARDRCTGAMATAVVRNRVADTRRPLGAGGLTR